MPLFQREKKKQDNEEEEYKTGADVAYRLLEIQKQRRAIEELISSMEAIYRHMAKQIEEGFEKNSLPENLDGESSPGAKHRDMVEFHDEFYRLRAMLDCALSHSGPEQFLVAWSDRQAQLANFGGKDFGNDISEMRSVLWSRILGKIPEALDNINSFGFYQMSPHYVGTIKLPDRQIKNKQDADFVPANQIEICRLKLKEFDKAFFTYGHHLITYKFCDALSEWRGDGMEEAKARMAREEREQAAASSGGQGGQSAIPLDERAVKLRDKFTALDVKNPEKLMPDASPSSDQELVKDYLIRNKAPLEAMVVTLNLIAESEEQKIKEMRDSRKKSLSRWAREKIGAARTPEDAAFDVQIVPVINRAENARTEAARITGALTELESFKTALPGPDVYTDMEVAMQLPFALQEAGILCSGFNNAYRRSSPRPAAMLELMHEAYPAAEHLLGVFRHENSPLQGLWNRLSRGDEEQRRKFDALLGSGRQGFDRASLPLDDEGTRERGRDGRPPRGDSSLVPPSPPGRVPER